MKIQSTSTFVSHGSNAIIYAPSGFGKTCLAGTLDEKTLIVSLESGLLSLHSKEIDYVEITGNTHKEKLKALMSICVDLNKGIDYKNIYFDSLTEITELFIEEADALFPDSKQALPKWGYYSKKVKSFIKFTRDLKGYNIFFTCLMKTDKDQLGRMFNVPDMAGSMARKVPQFFDLVLAIRIFEDENKEVRKLMTKATEGYICKDRSGLLSDYEDMNLQTILNKIGKHNE